MRRNLRLVAVAAAFAAAGYGQEIRTGVITGGRSSVPPYSAERITETVETLADGTHITHTSTNKVYRDSQGRTRSESYEGGTEGVKWITIIDPVARVKYTLNTQEKTARKRVIPTAQNQPSLQRAPAAGPAETPTHMEENLGKQTMEGLEVEGTRRTTTWPVGAVGNDQPIKAVSEYWWSDELSLVVMSKTSDPRTGDMTQKLTNLSRAAPDASLFQPPADYTVVEERPSAQ